MSYMTASSPKNTFLYSVHTFTHIRQHYFSKYWGGPMHGPSPTSNFGGTVPPRSPPLAADIVPAARSTDHGTNFNDSGIGSEL